MIITKVRYFPIERSAESHPLVACSVVFDGVFMVHDIKIFNGGIVVMPQKVRSGKDVPITNSRSNSDLCHPIDRDFFFDLKTTVLEGYDYFLKTGDSCFYPEG